MDRGKAGLTVFFEGPFWVGVFERVEKRRQREAGKQTMQAGIGTKSQQALQLQREERKTERRQAGREQKEAEKQRMFELKRQKRKEKHRGR